jgi:SAM-dependent methyltransferase
VSIIDLLHGSHIFPRRIRRLSELIDEVIPRNVSILDVGCGNGALDRLLLERRPDLAIQGIDVLLRNDLAIPVTKFDGETFPFPDGAFDVVMFIDVLHHTPDPMRLLREASRVARQGIVIKDHSMNGFMAETRLRFMDGVGNARYGVALPFNYWTKDKWTDAFGVLKLEATAMVTRLHLYPWPLDAIFGASLHFVARLEQKQRKPHQH